MATCEFCGCSYVPVRKDQRGCVKRCREAITRRDLLDGIVALIEKHLGPLEPPKEGP